MVDGATPADLAGICIERVVAVIATLANGKRQVGSGYVVADRLVLTAEHCTRDKSSGESQEPPVSLQVVRLSDFAESPAAVAALDEQPAASRALDIALLQIDDNSWPAPSSISVGRIDRQVPWELNPCEAVGFPLWQLDPNDHTRNPVHVRGPIRTVDDLGVSPARLVLRDPVLNTVHLSSATPPTEAVAPANGKRVGRSPWGGVSGALVFYRDIAIGVVVEHNPQQGDSALRIRPLETLSASDDPAALAIAKRLDLPDLNDWPIVTGDKRHDVIASLIATGDRLTLFRGEYERLADAYIDPLPVFERVALERFVGRRWLIREVDAFLAAHDCGYFVLEAPAGVGKTAFLAHLVKERAYLHHFVERAPGLDGVAAALKSLAAQLILARELLPYSVEEVLPGAAARPHFFTDLLSRAAEKARNSTTIQKLVIVVDALDEAGTPPGQNVLGLPDVLPKGIYFIVSKRPVEITLTVQAPRVVCRIEPNDKRNLNDVREYLNKASKRKAIASILQRNGYTEQQFATLLLTKSRGVWVYLRYVLDEIHRSERQNDNQGSPLDLDQLPEGLWQYYAEYWRRWRREHEEAWYDVHLPLLAMLAALAEEDSLEHLCVLAGLERRPELRRLLSERWRPFLVIRDKQERQYSLYHTSLRDFIEGRLDQEEVTIDEEEFSQELAEAAREAHDRIANHYLDSWKGLDQALPGLRGVHQWNLDNRYGLQHVVYHLAKARRHRDVHRLLRLQWHEANNSVLGDGQVRNAWYVIHDQVDDLAGYLGDIQQAWRLNEIGNAAEGERNQLSSGVGLQLRYALLSCSISNLAGGVEPALIIALVDEGRWTVERGLSYARQALSALQRAETLVGLLPHLSVEQRAAIIEEALQEARAIEQIKRGRWPRLAGHAEILARIAHQLPSARRAEVLAEAVATAGQIDDELTRVRTIVKLIPDLPRKLTADVLFGELDRGIKNAEAVAILMPYLREPFRLDLAERAVQIVKGSPLPWVSPVGLAALAPYLSEVARGQAVEEALSAARVVEETWAKTKTLALLVPLFPEPRRSSLVAEALATLRTLKPEESETRAEVLIQMAPHIGPQQMGEALLIVDSITNEWERCEPLATLALRLQQPLLDESLQMARSITRPAARAKALTALAAARPELKGRSLLEEALAAATTIDDTWDWAQALAALAEHLPPPQSNEVLMRASVAMRGAVDQMPAYTRSQALAKLATRLPQQGRDMLIDDALTAAEVVEGLAGEEDKKAKTLEILAPYLGEARIQRAMAIAKAFGHEVSRARAVAALTPWLKEPQRSRVLAKALGEARKAHLSSSRAEALAALVPHLPKSKQAEVLREALFAARAQNWPELRARALNTLLPYLTGSLREEVLEEVLELACDRITEPLGKGMALAAIAPYLPQHQMARALSSAFMIKEDWKRGVALEELIKWLPDSLLNETIASIRALRDEKARYRALAHLAERLPQEFLTETFSAIIAREDYDSDPLTTLAEPLSNLSKERFYSLWEEALPFLAARSRRTFFISLVALAPAVASAGGASAVQEAVSALEDIGAWFP